MTISLNAHFDGQRIVLDEPYALAPEARLLVTVLPGDDAEPLHAERRAWSTLSKRGMSRVFGDDEPEYSTADAKP